MFWVVVGDSYSIGEDQGHRPDGGEEGGDEAALEAQLVEEGPEQLRGDLWVTLLVQRYLSNTASSVSCMFRRVKDHHNTLFATFEENTC